MNSNPRILSLDVFRGITIFAMLVVNNPGDWGHIYPILKHAKWNGFLGADWIFPFFLFIIGFTIPVSFANYLHSAKSKRILLMKIARRSTLLFLLGIFLNGFPDFSWATIRIPGVLQRIAVVYFLSANFYLFLPRLFILILFIFLIFIHWFIVTQIPLPGMSETSLEIGKNISGWIDYYLMPNHLWIHSKTWDPEGILGTLTATASCLSGLLYGSIFSKEKKLTGYQYYLGIFMGILLISLSLVWSIVFPINKSLWTGSYVLLNTGLAIIVFHLLYENIDEAGARSWYYGFEVLGVNALTAFFLSSLFSKILNIPLVYNVSGKQVGIKSFLYSNYFTPFFSSYNASFFWALGYSFLWVLFFGILYKKKIFIKL